MSNFAGKKILVLGGSRGIGAAIVRRFAAEGARVTFTYASSADAALALAAETGSTAELTDSADRDAVIARVRSLVRQAQVAKDWLNVADTVEQVLDFVRAELNQRQVAVEVRLQEGLPPLLADESQLQQVILNLLLNALDALEGMPPEQRRVVIQVGQDTAGAIRLGVEDSGRGLTPMAREQMFEAFYTTKAQGMGLGLALSRSIVEAHGGRIWATSLPEGGTGVYCSLPKDPQP